MRDVLLVLFGAILGFLTHLFLSWLNQISKDREILFNALEILKEMFPFLDDLATPRDEIIGLSKKLLYFVMRIRSKRYSELAEKLIEFSRIGNRKTREETFKLIHEIAAITKSPLGRYHKKQNEKYRKAWEKLKRIGRG